MYIGAHRTRGNHNVSYPGRNADDSVVNCCAAGDTKLVTTAYAAVWTHTCNFISRP